MTDVAAAVSYMTTSASSTTVYISIPTGRRIRGRVKEVMGSALSPSAHPDKPHRWHEMLHFGERGTGFAECICGAHGIPYKSTRYTATSRRR